MEIGGENWLIPLDAELLSEADADNEAIESQNLRSRAWCEEHGLGRRIGGGAWSVSKVALAIFLDGDLKALRAYHAGDRMSERDVGYFERAGLR